MLKKLKKLVKKTSPTAAIASKANKVSKKLSPLNRRGGGSRGAGAATGRPTKPMAGGPKPTSRMR